MEREKLLEVVNALSSVFASEQETTVSPPRVDIVSNTNILAREGEKPRTNI